jgi:hypothetical protein
MQKETLWKELKASAKAEDTTNKDAYASTVNNANNNHIISNKANAASSSQSNNTM